MNHRMEPIGCRSSGVAYTYIWFYVIVQGSPHFIILRTGCRNPATPQLEPYNRNRSQKPVAGAEDPVLSALPHQAIL